MFAQGNARDLCGTQSVAIRVLERANLPRLDSKLVHLFSQGGSSCLLRAARQDIPREVYLFREPERVPR